jgi:hypothetical protein
VLGRLFGPGEAPAEIIALFLPELKRLAGVCPKGKTYLNWLYTSSFMLSNYVFEHKQNTLKFREI